MIGHQAQGPNYYERKEKRNGGRGKRERARKKQEEEEGKGKGKGRRRGRRRRGRRREKRMQRGGGRGGGGEGHFLSVFCLSETKSRTHLTPRDQTDMQTPSRRSDPTHGPCWTLSTCTDLRGHMLVTRHLLPTDVIVPLEPGQHSEEQEGRGKSPLH
jgi:hypothetical protein